MISSSSRAVDTGFPLLFRPETVVVVGTIANLREQRFSSAEITVERERTLPVLPVSVPPVVDQLLEEIQGNRAPAMMLARRIERSRSCAARSLHCAVNSMSAGPGTDKGRAPIGASARRLNEAVIIAQGSYLIV